MISTEDRLGWAFYIRTSPKDKITLASQRKALIRFANKNHFAVDEEFIDEKVLANRPSIRLRFSKMLEQIEAGKVNKIICLNKSRLVGNSYETALLEMYLHCGKLKKISYAEKKKKKTANRENGS